LSLYFISPLSLPTVPQAEPTVSVPVPIPGCLPLPLRQHAFDSLLLKAFFEQFAYNLEINQSVNQAFFEQFAYNLAYDLIGTIGGGENICSMFGTRNF
jgi:hypothetical protein